MSTPDQAKPPARSRPPRTRRRRLFTFRRVLLLMLLLVAGAGAGAERLATRRLVQGTGYVMTREVAKIRPAVEGVLQRFLVESGTLVEQGQVLIQLDDSLQRATHEELRGRIRAEEAELQRLASDQELERARRAAETDRALLTQKLAQQHLERLRAGAATVARMEIEEAEVRVEIAASQLQELRLPREALMDNEIAVLRERIAAARMHLPVLEAEAALRLVRSPLRGTVYFHAMSTGEIVKPADELGQVFDRDRWIVKLKLPETRIVHVREGQPVRIALSAYPAMHHGYLAGTVSRVDRLMTPQSTGDAIFYVEATLEPPAEIQLQPGLSAWAQIDCGQTTWLRRILRW